LNITEKIEVLRKFGTRDLIDKLPAYEAELLEALTEQVNYTGQNCDYVASRGSDCPRVKEIIAELLFQAPEANEAGKKTTVAEKDAWLTRQRTENSELKEAISQQRQVSFRQEDYEIKCEIARRRLTSAVAVLALRTAQINFLGGD